jgi:hypothetical protein
MAHEQASSGDTITDDRGVIKVYIRDLDQLFDSLDPSPFHERDLDRAAHEYIVSVAKELPGSAPAALVVFLDRQIGLAEEAHLLGEAIRIYFDRQSQTSQRSSRQRLRRGWGALIVGLVLLVSSVIVSQAVVRRMGQGPLATVLHESLLIGGWVAMWRPMDFFLYEYWVERAQLRIYQRLSRAAVRIVYDTPNPAKARARSVSSVSRNGPAPHQTRGRAKSWQTFKESEAT